MALLLAVLGQGVDSMASSWVSPLAPFLQADLAISRAQIGLIHSAMRAGSMGAMMLGGRAVDIFGIRRSLAASLGLAGLLAIVISGMPAYWMILVVGVALGIAHGPANPAVTKAVAQWFPARSRGTAMSIKQAGFPLAGMLMAAVLPVLAQDAGWRPILTGTGVFVIAVGIFSFLVYREHPSDSPLKARSVSFREAGRQLLSRNMLALGSMAALLTGVQMAALTYLVLYMKEFQGLPVVEAGVLLSVAYAGGALGRVTWGLVSDRLFGGSRRQVLMLVTVLSCATMAGLAVAPAGLPTAALALVAFLVGLSAMGWNGVYFAFIVELSGSATAATAVGFSMTFQQVGNLAAPPIFGMLVDVSGTYLSAWLLMLAMTVAGGLCVSLIRERG